MIRRLFILLVIVTSISSCRKEQDERAPQINILSPSEFSNFSVGDQIIVEVSVSDDKNLEYVRVDITNLNQARVAGPVEYFNFSGTSDQRSIGIDIDNVQLESGIYYIRAIVGDGENERVEFLEISLSELPLKLRRIFAFKALNPNSTDIDSLDRQNLNWVSAGSASFGFGKAQIFSGANEIQFLAGSGSGLEFRDGIDLSLIQSHSLPSGGFPNPFWKSSYLDEAGQKYYCSSSDGKIRSYRPGGITDLNFEIGSSSSPSTIAVNNNYILVEQNFIGQGLDQIAMYFTGSGSFMQSAVIESDLIDIIPYTESKVLLFGNLSNGDGKVWIFDIAANGYSAALSLSDYQLIKTAIRGGGNTYFLADESGIHKFELSSGGTLSNGGQVLLGDYTQLSIDKLSGALYALESSAQRLDIINTFNLSVVESIDLPFGTQQFGLMYNR